MKRSLALFVATAVLGTLATGRGDDAARSAANRGPDPRETPAYHHQPPDHPLPVTLDPAMFKKNRRAFVAYALAARIRSILYQVPCYCRCDKALGHQSLIDCFTSQHGVACPRCQREVIFCFMQWKKGKNVVQIREAMAKGEGWNLDLSENTDRLYQQIQGKD